MALGIFNIDSKIFKQWRPCIVPAQSIYTAPETLANSGFVTLHVCRQICKYLLFYNVTFVPLNIRHLHIIHLSLIHLYIIHLYSLHLFMIHLYIINLYLIQLTICIFMYLNSYKCVHIYNTMYLSGIFTMSQMYICTIVQ